MRTDNIETFRDSIQSNYFSQPVDEGKLAADMAKTFAARRQEIVREKPSVDSLVKRWPAVFSPSQVCSVLSGCECSSENYFGSVSI